MFRINLIKSFLHGRCVVVLSETRDHFHVHLMSINIILALAILEIVDEKVDGTIENEEQVTHTNKV